MKITAFGTVLLLLVAPMEAAKATRGSRVREIDIIEENPKEQSHRQLQIPTLADRKLDFEIKKRVCEEIENSLDKYYAVITDILVKAPRLRLQIEFLCKNDANLKDPGLRAIASYTRFDFVEKCKQAEQAECEFQRATASSQAKALLRKPTLRSDGVQFFELKIVNTADVQKEARNGFSLVSTCAPFEPSPYLSKPLPFSSGDANTICQGAGFKNYMD